MSIEILKFPSRPVVALRVDGRHQGRQVMDRFTAHAGAVEVLGDYNTFLVVLAESKDGRGARLEFQRSIEPDDDDIARGSEAYCLVTQMHASCYGGVKWWNVKKKALNLLLTERTADTIGTTCRIAIDMELPQSEIDAIVAGLERVFGFPQSEGHPS
jgi:hypothetical protein